MENNVSITKKVFSKKAHLKEVACSPQQHNLNSAVPFQDPLLIHLEISVSESEKRANGTLNLREYYTVYLIETKYIFH